MKHYQHTAGEYTLDVWGSGISCALTHNPTGKSVYLQGDDALTFETELEAAELAFPYKSDAEIFAWLWDQCDYGSITQ